MFIIFMPNIFCYKTKLIKPIEAAKTKLSLKCGQRAQPRLFSYYLMPQPGFKPTSVELH